MRNVLRVLAALPFVAILLLVIVVGTLLLYAVGDNLTGHGVLMAIGAWVLLAWIFWGAYWLENHR